MLGFLKPNTPVPHHLVAALDSWFNEHELRKIDAFSTPIRLEAGARLTAEGSLGVEVLLVLSGTADVVRDGEVIATVGRADLVGEISVMTGQPRNATVVATSDVEVAVFTRAEFSSLLAACPRLEVKTKQLVDARS